MKSPTGFSLFDLSSISNNRKTWIHIRIFWYYDASWTEITKLSEFNHYQNADEIWFIIHADLACLILKIDGCKNNPENSSTTKVGKHISSGFSMSTISSIKSIEKKHDAYRGKDCIKKFCKSLTEHSGDNY